jgi:hypothetical protein
MIQKVTGKIACSTVLFAMTSNAYGVGSSCLE